jgi:choline dehydrogenase-like flavoprotein
MPSSMQPAHSAELVVVGAGSAGAVIAARVTERADRDVLLLEAGPDYAADSAVPADIRDGTRNSWLAHDWRYRHRPTPGQILFVFPRGKVVGGSSAVNTCIALRGQPYDYDEWAARGLLLRNVTMDEPTASRPMKRRARRTAGRRVSGALRVGNDLGSALSFRPPCERARVRQSA